MARTAARADMVISNNATWEDAFMFGVTGDTSWDFNGKTFLVDIKGNRSDPNALLSLSSVDSEIIVDDLVARVLHFNVDRSAIVASLPVTTPGDEPYVYDMVMVVDATDERILLMGGCVYVEQGVTQ